MNMVHFLYIYVFLLNWALEPRFKVKSYIEISFGKLKKYNNSKERKRNTYFLLKNVNIFSLGYIDFLYHLYRQNLY
jgi:hypothetical protein